MMIIEDTMSIDTRMVKMIMKMIT